MGEPDGLITPHDCWLMLGNNDDARMAAYHALLKDKLNQPDIDHIRQSLNTGLPTGNEGFRQTIETALSIRLGTENAAGPERHMNKCIRPLY